MRGLSGGDGCVSLVLFAPVVEGEGVVCFGSFRAALGNAIVDI